MRLFISFKTIRSGLIVFTILFVTSGRAVSATECGSYLERMRATFSSSAFTDPGVYVPGQPFRFLVHALAGPYQRLVAQLAQVDLARRGERVNFKYIDLTSEPERVADKRFISTSVIHDSNTNTWADVGLILAPESGHIVAADLHDLGSPHLLGDPQDEEEFQRVFDSFSNRMMSLEQLVKHSTSYNEVLLRGQDELGRPVRLVGFFAKTQDGVVGEDDLDNFLAINVASQRLKLPLLILPEVRASYPDERVFVSRDHVTKASKMISWQSEGVRHVYSFYEGTPRRYDAFKNYGEINVKTPENLQKFIRALRAAISSDPDIAEACANAGIVPEDLRL